ncbi:MAG: prephenate dehydrogenase [Flavobacteriales bacterium]|nr:prephenate dehydrogenase [Flavobacteriales bacterium]
MKVCVIGVGLIGGSLVRDIKRQYPYATIYGIDKNPAHVKLAKELGIIDEIANFESISDAKVVIVSIPVNALLKELPEILDKVGDDTIVFEVGSTKRPVCKLVENHPKRRNYLATHPIAGTEFSGPTAAIEGLFKGKTNIICEYEKTDVVLGAFAVSIFEKIGMKIRYMKPKSHDKHIAYVSHLSHISSFMLGKTVIEKEKNERDIFDMAGSGFESTVRLAKSSPAMWTPIFEQNRKYVTESLGEYIDNLKRFKKLLEQEDYEAVFEEMESVNRIKTILEGIRTPK